MIQTPKFVAAVLVILAGCSIASALPLNDSDFARLSRAQVHGNKHTLVYVGDKTSGLQIFSEGRKLGKENFDLRYGPRPEPRASQATNDISDPFILAHPYKTSYVVIYFHGITDSAYQGKDLAQAFFNAGQNFMSARLSGHGIDSSHINEITLEDWRQDVDDAIESAKVLGEKVILTGLSTGGALIVDKAYRDPKAAAAVIAMAPAIGIQNVWVRDLEAAGLLESVSEVVPYIGSESMTQIEVRQRRKGTHSVHVLYELGQAVQKRIRDGELFPDPLFLISSSQDTQVQPEWLTNLINVAPYGHRLAPQLSEAIHSGIVYEPSRVVYQFPYTEELRDEDEELPFATLDESNPEFGRMFSSIQKFIQGGGNLNRHRLQTMNETRQGLGTGFQSR